MMIFNLCLHSLLNTKNEEIEFAHRSIKITLLLRNLKRILTKTY